jgi:hypothetical protein
LNIPKLKIYTHNICLFIAFLVPAYLLHHQNQISLSVCLHITASCKLPPLLTYPLVRVPVWKLMKKKTIPFFSLLALLANTSVRTPSIIFPPQATL